jgi:hypothetical protein
MQYMEGRASPRPDVSATSKRGPPQESSALKAEVNAAMTFQKKPATINLSIKKPGQIRPGFIYTTISTINVKTLSFRQTLFQRLELFSHFDRQLLTEFRQIGFGICAGCFKSFGIDLHQLFPIFSRNVQTL